MAKNTWFLPPDFTFLPDGEIALGSLIPEPSRPTATLAALKDHPDIAQPETKTLSEKNRGHSSSRSRSAGVDFLAKIMDLASASAKADLSWYKNKSFSSTDHEVRVYSGSFAPAALRAIVGLESVRRHMEGGRWGKRCVYVITGLRVTPQSFTVTDERGKSLEASAGGSGPAPAGAAPVELGGNLTGSRGDNKTDGYDTAPGIVFAYRLHVIRLKGTGDAEAELFADRTAFCSGEAEDEEDEMEIVEVNGAALRDDLDVDEGGYEVFDDDDEDSFVVFKSATDEERKS